MNKQIQGNTMHASNTCTIFISLNDSPTEMIPESKEDVNKQENQPDYMGKNNNYKMS